MTWIARKTSIASGAISPVGTRRGGTTLARPPGCFEGSSVRIIPAGDPAVPRRPRDPGPRRAADARGRQGGDPGRHRVGPADGERGGEPRGGDSSFLSL